MPSLPTPGNAELVKSFKAQRGLEGTGEYLQLPSPGSPEVFTPHRLRL